MDITVNADFEEQLRTFLIANCGLNPSEDKYKNLLKLDTYEIARKFLYDFRTNPKTLGQRVHYSKELLESEDYKIFKNEIHNIENIFNNSLDITPYLSKKAKNRFGNSKKDTLLTAWNINHIHLKPLTGVPNTNNEMIACLITYNDVYFISIIRHGDWGKLDMLKIIRDNWPKCMPLLKYNGEYQMVLNDGTNIEQKEKELLELRENGCSTMIELDGEIYSQTITCSKDSIKDITFLNNLFDNYRLTRTLLEENRQRIFKTILKLNGKPQKPAFSFKWLKPLEIRAELYEEYSKLNFFVYKDAITKGFFAIIGNSKKAYKIELTLTPHSMTHQTHPQQNEQV